MSRWAFVVVRRRVGFATIETDGDRAIWTRRKLRKPAPCAVCGETLAKGALAYAPLGNQMYRMARIGAEHIESLRAEPMP